MTTDAEHMRRVRRDAAEWRVQWGAPWADGTCATSEQERELARFEPGVSAATKQRLAQEQDGETAA